ncbi:phage tail protein [Sphingobium aromaticiconvertens]|uniref:phage tail protein n=1 Tax=Sphingobium aromaticiconvertens TaxID=365341 RepID=UPI003019C3D6
MATLLLTAVGTALGGPIGGAIGAMAGRAFDQAVLFRPKGRTGPRINDLQVQTSSYGSQIPRLFGTMRVAGTVIWATDLRETTSKSGGGKGRPSVTSYEYAASFAVALSARPIRAVKRIWAEGNLLRGSAGDFKTELGAFRVHLGGEDQPVDPLIASAQGIDHAPAHRGIAYVVFEDLALADYGNRIPSLTFEIEADEGAVKVVAIAAMLSDGAIEGEGLGVVGGYAASGGNVSEALVPLVEGFGLALDGTWLRAVGGEVEVVAATSLCSRVNGRARDPVTSRSGMAQDVPVQLSLRHYDAARDYQAGVQKVARPGPGRVEQGIDMPAMLAADEARELAAVRLRSAWAGRATMEVQCGWEALTIRPGSLVSVGGIGGHWRVEEREWEAMAVRLTLRRVPGGAVGLPEGASGGAIVREVDAPHGATTLMLVDLPPLEDVAATGPVVVAVASGGAGWRRAALFSRGANGVAEPLGRSALRATLGRLATPLAAGSATMIDRARTCEVALLADDMALGSSDESGLAQGRNLCLIGQELVQFEAAVQTGAGTWRLSGLRRGLRGSEWAMALGHGEDTPFLLVEQERLAAMPASAFAGTGGVLTVLAIGIGDAEPAEAMLTVRGEAMAPPAPVHGRVKSDGEGGLVMSWVRRSRIGWTWRDGVETPLGEEVERYGGAVMAGDTAIRTVETASPAWIYDAAMIAADVGFAPGEGRHLALWQIGALGAGRALRIALPV